jgi:ferritin
MSGTDFARRLFPLTKYKAREIKEDMKNLLEERYGFTISLEHEQMRNYSLNELLQYQQEKNDLSTFDQQFIILQVLLRCQKTDGLVLEVIHKFYIFSKNGVSRQIVFIENELNPDEKYTKL